MHVGAWAAPAAAALLWWADYVNVWWVAVAAAVYAGWVAWQRWVLLLRRRRTAARCAVTGFRALVVGCGLSGIAAALRLRALGIPFIMVDAANDVGGTWTHNRYPGAQCDSPTYTYSLSEYPAPAKGWSRHFPFQPEILAYIREVVEVHNLTPYIRLNTRVVSARWDPEYLVYHVTMRRHAPGAPPAAGEEVYEAFHCVFSAVGMLGVPRYPQGARQVGGFRGPQMHTSQWDPSVGLEGKTVAVVGSAASAIQLVPAIAKAAKHVYVIQRTPNWVLPQDDREFGALWRWCLATLPGVAAVLRQVYLRASDCRHYLFLRSAHGVVQQLLKWRCGRCIRAHVPDLAAHLTPTYAVGCKRVLLSDRWYETLARPNVELLPCEVKEVTAHGLRCGMPSLRALPPHLPGGQRRTTSPPRTGSPLRSPLLSPHALGLPPVHQGSLLSPRNASRERMGRGGYSPSSMSDTAFPSSPLRRRNLRSASPPAASPRVTFSPSLPAPPRPTLRSGGLGAPPPPAEGAFSTTLRALMPGLSGGWEPGRYAPPAGGSPPRGYAASTAVTDVVADVIVWATGFDPRATCLAPFQLIGEGGVTQDQYVRHNGAEYYLGSMMPGFPNFFQLLGPNSALGHNSVLAMSEAQLDHAEALLHYLHHHNLHSIAVKANYTGTYNDSLQHRLAQSVWAARHGGCSSWYADEATGKVLAMWPGTVAEFQERCRAPVDFAHFAVQ